MCSWNIFGAWSSHGHTRTYKTHHSPNLREATTFFLTIFFVISHEGCIQMSFCHGTPNLGVSKFSKLGLLTLWRVIIFCTDLRFKWGLKQSCSPRWDIFKDMWHATYTHLFQGDSILLMSKSQIDTLTLSLSFGHNFYSNGSCEPILDI